MSQFPWATGSAWTTLPALELPPQHLQDLLQHHSWSCCFAHQSTAQTPNTGSLELCFAPDTAAPPKPSEGFGRVIFPFKG